MACRLRAAATPYTNHHRNNSNTPQQLGLWGRENGTMFESQKEFMEQSGFKHSVGALELIAMGAYYRSV